MVSLAGTVMGQALLAPPFGRKWAESPTGLLKWAERHSLDVTVEMPGKRRGLQIFNFAQEGGGLPGHEADSIEARFYQGQLYEITVNYEFPGSKAEEVHAKFESLRKYLDSKYGKLALNRKDRVNRDGFVFTEASYHHEPSPQVFLLIAYSGVEDTLRKSTKARFSLVYHNGNVGPPGGGGLTGKD